MNGEQSPSDKKVPPLEYLGRIAAAFDPVDGPVEFAPGVWMQVRNAIFELERELPVLRDHPIARMQVGPDGVVPTGTVQALELWKAEADRLHAELAEERAVRQRLDHAWDAMQPSFRRISEALEWEGSPDVVCDQAASEIRKLRALIAPSAASSVVVSPAVKVSAALAELVFLKDLKERIEKIEPPKGSATRNYYAEELRDEYERRKVGAWAAARAALDEIPAPSSASSSVENLSPQSIVEWASSWVPEANRARFADALKRELAVAPVSHERATIEVQQLLAAIVRLDLPDWHAVSKAAALVAASATRGSEP